MSNKKKALYIGLGTIDVILTVGLFVISIIMLATLPTEANPDNKGPGFIAFFQDKEAGGTTVFLWAIVVPLFVLLAVNILVLILYVKKTSEAENKPVGVSDLSASEKEALKNELLKELMAAQAQPEAPKEEPQIEEAKEEAKEE